LTAGAGTYYRKAGLKMADKFTADKSKTDKFTMDQASGHMTKKQNAIQFIKFTLFSASAGAIQFLTSAALHELTHIPDWMAYLFPLILSVVYNFTLNRRFTFKSATNYPLAMLKVTGYYLIFTPVSTWWVDQLTALNWNFYVIIIGTLVVNFVTEFLFDRYVVFGKSIGTNKQAQKEREKSLLKSESAVSNAD
jgi:putative flippase GtrA